MKWKELKENIRLKKVYDLKILILRLIREFFWSQDFLEVETPIALKYPSQEPYLNFIPVEFHNPKGEVEKFYLRTSPEFALKKILGAGYSKIFEIGKCFRDYEEWGGNHNTEFTMLEFYRASGNQHKIMSDLEELFKYIAKCLKIKKLKDCEIVGGWKKITMKELWESELNIDLDKNLDLISLSKTARKLGFNVDKNDAYEDVFYKIFLNKIESKLGFNNPIFIYDYPAQMCSLSKKCKYNKKYAERFELYINGLEICNGFGELTDSEEQKKLLLIDKNKRMKLGKEIWDIDNDFIEGIKSLNNRVAVLNSEVSGVALGVDRMIKLFAGANDLNEVIFCSVFDQIDNN